jgi:hypothetical protein
MNLNVLESEPVPIGRRTLLSILTAGAAGCLGCARAAFCAELGQDPPPPPPLWTAKADVTYEEMFRFAYQKDLIPLLKQLGETLGREKLIAMLREAADEVTRRKTAGRPPQVPNLVALAAGMKNIPPLIRHTLEAEVVEQTADAFEYRVSKCLWAKIFRESDAADIGYAYVCYPDYAAAKGLNPKLKLVRTKTLMQGDESCGLRYIMES